MLEIKNFSKSYNGVKVYDNFDFELKEGEITCILGESGCGKTTLLNALAGLISYDGILPKLSCSYVFQSPRLVPNLTVADNLKLVCKDGQAVTDMLKRVRLENKADKFPVNLSGGEAQRVALARAFLYGGEMMLMDEPFSSLDLKLKYEMLRLFYEIWEKDKKSTVFVTHDIDEAIGLAHRIAVLKDGRIIYDRALASGQPRGPGSEEALRRELISVLI